LAQGSFQVLDGRFVTARYFDALHLIYAHALYIPTNEATLTAPAETGERPHDGLIAAPGYWTR
jgi:hypothetical protein